MAVPNSFDPGEVASSAEVNENFDHLSSLVGGGSNGDELHPPGPIVLNDMAQLNARSSEFLQVSWNINLYVEGGQVKQARLQEGEAATALRVGGDGFEVLTTSGTQGSLQLKKVFGIHATSGKDYVYLDPTWHMTITDAAPNDHGDYRLTYVPFKEPKVIYEGVWKGATTKVHDATALGVPSSAVAIQVMAYATATTASGAAIRLYKAGSTHYKYGFICHAYGGNSANYGRSGAQGTVLLGEGAHAGKFVERRTANFEEASLFIQGYFI